MILSLHIYSICFGPYIFVMQNMQKNWISTLVGLLADNEKVKMRNHLSIEEELLAPAVCFVSVCVKWFIHSTGWL